MAATTPTPTTTITTTTTTTTTTTSATTSNDDEWDGGEKREDNVNLLQAWISHDSLDFHKFDSKEAAEIREKLLTWYDENRRKLPWRGDPPPWEGSTANFGKSKNKKSSKKKTTKNGDCQKTIKQYFTPVPKEGQLPLNNNKNNEGERNEDEDEDDDDDKEKQEPTFPVTAYGVWVSEIMLQQTRVEAVVPYWVRWMKTFPSIYELAQASEEQVNALWAGLGFYRRARLLHMAAQQLVKKSKNFDEAEAEANGHTNMPTTVDGLLELPGIGRYTACAIASIAYNATVPVVDGNVCRVLARLKAIANHVKAPALKDVHGWSLAQQLVQAGDASRPGDLNQALMELGATYCAPSGTGTDPRDPLRDFYFSTRLARQLAKVQAQQGGGGGIRLDRPSHSIRNHGNGNGGGGGGGCPVCCAANGGGGGGVEEALQSLKALLQQAPPLGASLDAADLISQCGHKIFPMPPPKTVKREEVLAVAVLSRTHASTKQTSWLLVQRTKDGLLAGQWEFPSSTVWTSNDKDVNNGCGMTRKRKNKDRATDTAADIVPSVPLNKRRKALDALLQELCPNEDNLALTKRQCFKEPMEHIFSHVRHTMWIEHASIDENGNDDDDDNDDNNDGPQEKDAKAMRDDDETATNDSSSRRLARWMTELDMETVGVTSGVKKILQAVSKAQRGEAGGGRQYPKRRRTKS